MPIEKSEISGVQILIPD
jgi:hypothetical protein